MPSQATLARVFVVIVALVHSFCHAALPTIQVTRLTSKPIISSLDSNPNSAFRYNYNAALLPIQNSSQNISLAVRVQNLKPFPGSLYDVGPSQIALSTCHISNTGITCSNITQNQVFFNSSLGVEDPRIVQYEQSLYMFYTNLVSVTKTSNDITAQLNLAVCTNPSDWMHCWKPMGPLFPELKWSKSGALLLQPETGLHYLFWGDLDISIATTKDLLHYENSGTILIPRRPDNFDSELVESGPEPLPLKNGDYLFLYNSARKTNIPNPKPNWNLEYNLGYVILDGKNPLQIKYRSEQPILSPELDWEKCDYTSGTWAAKGLTPNVVFVEGWKQLDEDTFLIIYQGCDSVVGMAKLVVQW